MSVFKSNERQLKKVEDLEKPEKKDTKGKLDTNFYVPKYKEYKPRAKDISNKEKRIKEQKKKGLLQENPGVKTERGEEFVKQLEDLTGQEQNQIGTYTEAPGGGTPLARGTKAPSDEWVKEHRQMQPRDPETGQFEYNNANAKGVKYPSRGKKTPMFIKGPGFDVIFKKNEHIIIDDQGRTAIARLDMTENEFKESVINASEKLGFTTRWTSETKKGRKSKAEHEALERGDRGRLGNRVYKLKENKDGGFDVVGKSEYGDKPQQTYGDLSKAQERQIVSTDSDQSKFKIDVDKQNEIKAYQERNKRQQDANAEARKVRDESLNNSWENGNISDEMVKAVKEVYPVKAIQEAKNPKKAIQKLMNMKNPKTGKKRFKNFEDFRHWALGNHAGPGK